MDKIKEFKYKKIKNFLTLSETNILKDYCRIKHRLNKQLFDTDPEGSGTTNSDTSIYADPLMESLLINKNSEMEKLTGLSLKPTYALWRMYTKFAELAPHKDRRACEISATINVGSDGTDWPIFIDHQLIYLNPGEALVYLGRDLTHWRGEFTGDWQAQVFLHYVDANGPFADQWKDKRIKWGSKFINIEGSR
tara:strand:- start:1607 stop:2185 length:579 start_codon:yes stop_codon:yes gene_type:complete